MYKAEIVCVVVDAKVVLFCLLVTEKNWISFDFVSFRVSWSHFAIAAGFGAKPFSLWLLNIWPSGDDCRKGHSWGYVQIKLKIVQTAYFLIKLLWPNCQPYIVWNSVYGQGMKGYDHVCSSMSTVTVIVATMEAIMGQKCDRFTVRVWPWL